jgi:hypothetical protein
MRQQQKEKELLGSSAAVDVCIKRACIRKIMMELMGMLVCQSVLVIKQGRPVESFVADFGGEGGGEATRGIYDPDEKVDSSSSGLFICFQRPA